MSQLGFIGGAIIGLVVAVLALIINENIGNWMRTRSSRKAIARSLDAEISAIWDRYTKIFGKYLEETAPGQAIRASFSLQENYFRVYDANCDMLGIFDEETARYIVSVYTNARAYTETLCTLFQLSATPKTFPDDMAAYSDTVRIEHI